MNGWNKVVLGVVAAGMIGLAVGCDDVKQLKIDKQQLTDANAKLRTDLDASNQENGALRTERDGLQAQVVAKDKMIADMRAAGPGKPPVVVAPPKKGPANHFGPEDDVTVTGGVITVSLASDLLFDSGKAAVKAAASPAVKRIAGILTSKYPGRKIRVVGHTDSDPIRKSGWKDNWDLSFERARAVGLALIKDGVPSRNIEMVGAGDTEPRVSPEKTAADKARNRRVGIQVVVDKD